MLKVLPAPLTKHELDGIGGASATALLALLLSNPSTAGLASGVVGKIIFYAASKVFSFMASGGLVFLNVGAENIRNAILKHGFDGTFDNAIRLVEEIQATGRLLTPEEIKAIDEPVKAAFRKFGRIGGKKKKS